MHGADFGAAGCHKTLFRGHEFIPDNDAGDWCAACGPGLTHLRNLQIPELVHEENYLILPGSKHIETWQYDMILQQKGDGHPIWSWVIELSARTNQGSTPGQPPSDSGWEVKTDTVPGRLMGFAGIPNGNNVEIYVNHRIWPGFGASKFWDNPWLLWRWRFAQCCQDMYCSIWVLTRLCRSKGCVRISHWRILRLKMISLLRYKG